MTNINKNQLSKEVSKKFQLIDNTLKRSVKQNPKDKIEVEIGDSKQPDFKPQFKIMRWDNEVNFSMRAKEHPDAVVETAGDVVKYKTPDYEVHQYEKPEAGEDGGFEFEWILPEKPTSNVLEATIQTKELDFFYQPQPTQQEIDEGLSMPENVVGSYAVYHKTKQDNAVGEKEYKTGKAFHIYRPKAIDLNGLETWCDLEVDENSGLLKVTVPQKFLDEAQYPVKVDPTFGYTSIGASSANTANNRAYATIFNLPTAGDLTDVNIALFNGAASGENFKALVLDNDGSGSSPGTIKALSSAVANTNTATVVGSATFFTATVSVSLASDNWGLGAIFNSTQSLARDTVSSSGFTMYQDTSGNSYASPTTFGNDAGVNSVRISIYATYTTSGTNYTRSLSESVKIAESASKTLSFSRNRPDGITAVESLKRSSEVARFRSDNSSIQDSLKLTIQINRGVFEEIGIQDIVTRLQSSARANTDITTINDNTSVARTVSLFLQEMQVISDILGAEVIVEINIDGEDGPIIESISFNVGSPQSIEEIYNDHKAYNTHIPYYSGRSNDVSPTVLENVENSANVESVIVSLSETESQAPMYDDHKIYDSHTPYYVGRSNDVSPTVELE